MRTSLIILMTICALFRFADNTWACSCISVPIELRVAQHPAVFIGEIVAVKHNQNRVPLQNANPQQVPRVIELIDTLVGPGTVDATFRVTRVVKGTMKAGELITVRTSDQDSACGFPRWLSQVNRSWIIYAEQTSGIPLLGTGLCSGSTESTSPAAAENIRYFDTLKTPGQ